MAETPDNSLDITMPDSQEFIEPNVHSFVVKIWFEEADAGDSSRPWRGYITHVASGKRQYLTQLPSITQFIKSYLSSMYPQPTVIRRIRRFFSKRN